MLEVFEREHGDLVNRGPQLRSSASEIRSPSGESEDGIVNIAVDTALLGPRSLPHSLPPKGENQRISANISERKIEKTPANFSELKHKKVPENTGVLTIGNESDIVLRLPGEVAERLNAPVSKTG